MSNQDDTHGADGRDDPQAFMGFDFSDWARQLQVPGMDVSAMVDAGRADLEAVAAANQVAAEGWQRLAQKQVSMWQDATAQWQEQMTEALSGSPEQNVEQQARLAQEGLSQMLSDMREMAQIVTESQTKAAEVLGERFQRNLQRMMNPGSQNE